ncbi:hypothetical protein NM688_g3661 [Phlebia brevispora]|uniref:Uncharacterized protein n=1 Tax=Phlebia brevispora TaxID=194682 RepID=A0ACC1T590_9APHY|nr:hypothetical protein NM688_g3661 [Phlebia brevispora]
MSGAVQKASSRSTESSPLLAPEERFDDALDSPVVAVNPLPRAQLAIIYCIKLVVPISGTQAMPYVNKMVAAMNLPGDRSVGYYSGLLVTSHTAGQFLTIFFWGRLSDRIGRTPVIGIGMAGLAISTILFGLSSTLSAALFTRFLTGVFGGFIGVIHSVVGELSDKTNQSTAFPFYDIISALGFIIGPIIGGTFAEPATEFPKWFDYSFFRSYPYVLPCIICGILGFSAALLSVTYLRETHPHKSGINTPVNEPPEAERPILLPTEGSIEEEKPPSVRSLMALPVIRAICSSQWMLGFIAASFNTVFVLMSYTEIKDGGLSMNTILTSHARLRVLCPSWGWSPLGSKPPCPFSYGASTR